MHSRDGRGRGWDGTPSGIGPGVLPQQGMPKFESLWDSRKRERFFFFFFMRPSVIRNAKHVLTSGLTVLAVRPVLVQTAPAEKSGNPGKVRRAAPT